MCSWQCSVNSEMDNLLHKGNLIISFTFFALFFLVRPCVTLESLSSEKQPQATFKGLTILEPPFIYSESGPYRGFVIDIIDNIARKVSFNYTLQQSPDGQIGSARLLNGIFIELYRNTFDFAIGDISRNWLNDEKKAADVGVLFTKPIFTSTMSVLLTKNLLYNLETQKENECIQKIKKNREKSNNKVSITYCSKSLRLDDIYESPQLTRIALNMSPIHEFYSTVDQKYLPLINWVEKASLFGYGLDKLKSDTFVLIDETKFTHYLADQEDQFELVDVAYAHNDGSENVRFDDLATSYESDYRARNFRNEIVIALSKTTVDQFSRERGRDLLVEFNQVIEQMRKSGKLQELQDKHWKQKYLKLRANSSVAFLPFSISFFVAIFILCIICL